MTRTILLALFFLSIALSRAYAQDDAQAREHYAAGQAHVAAGRYADAYGEFAAGFALSGRATFLVNMAECALHDGRRDDARRDYGRYLERAPDGAMSATARERLEELGPAPELRPASVPKPAQIAAAIARREIDLT